jgi:small-conductance mechanosensitive channel
MKDFLDANVIKIIITIVIILLFQIIQYVLNRFLQPYLNSRTQSVLAKKTINFIFTAILIIILIALWGVNPQNILISLSSIFAVIGVALFAQWSILSNITAGLVLFFAQQLKIGDKIQILDKDFPIIAEVEDIRSFYIYLRGEDKQLYIYPNNLLLQKGISIVNSKKQISKASEEFL